MSHSTKTAMLINALRPWKNGAVVDDMTARGITYRVSWGVSIPKIREIAQKFAPDHDFGKFLYERSLRESRIAALTIADPSKVGYAELGFWKGGIDNNEMAENLASSLLCKTELVDRIAGEWLAPEEDILIRYCALITLAKSMDNDKCTLDREQLTAIVDRDINNSDRLLAMAASNLEMKL